MGKLNIYDLTAELNKHTSEVTFDLEGKTVTVTQGVLKLFIATGPRAIREASIFLEGMLTAHSLMASVNRITGEIQ